MEGVAAELKPFHSDGCSLFPDENFMTQQSWCGCCVAHDVAYWQGGTSEERKQADQALKDCVAKATGDETLASLMYDGVRMGGSPYFYNWYRWGYGWSYGRLYQPLTENEKRRAEMLLEAYLLEADNALCPE